MVQSHSAAPLNFSFKTAWFNLLIFGSRSMFHSLTQLSGTSPIMQSYRANPQKQPILQHLQKSIGYKPTERLTSLRPSDWQGQASNSQPLKKSHLDRLKNMMWHSELIAVQKSQQVKGRTDPIMSCEISKSGAGNAPATKRVVAR